MKPIQVSSSLVLSVLLLIQITWVSVRGDDPSWSNWMRWSQCPSKCGPAISVRSRVCRGFKNGRIKISRNCQGTTRQIRQCRDNPCPASEPTPQQKACSKYDRRVFSGKQYEWEPSRNLSDPCKLSCRAKDAVFYANLAGRVQDGVECGKDGVMAVCIRGACQPVGCDGIVQSGARKDKCGRCQGDGTACKTISGIFTSTQLTKGLNHVLTIPPGSTNINVTELAPSENMLVLETEEGMPLINADHRKSMSVNVKAAGTFFRYSARTSINPREIILSDGPTEATLVLKVLSKGRNPGIIYTFSVPNDVNDSYLKQLVASQPIKPPSTAKDGLTSVDDKTKTMTTTDTQGGDDDHTTVTPAQNAENNVNRDSSRSTLSDTTKSTVAGSQIIATASSHIDIPQTDQSGDGTVTSPDVNDVNNSTDLNEGDSPGLQNVKTNTRDLTVSTHTTSSDISQGEVDLNSDIDKQFDGQNLGADLDQTEDIDEMGEEDFKEDEMDDQDEEEMDDNVDERLDGILGESDGDFEANMSDSEESPDAKQTESSPIIDNFDNGNASSVIAPPLTSAIASEISDVPVEEKQKDPVTSEKPSFRFFSRGGKLTGFKKPRYSQSFKFGKKYSGTSRRRQKDINSRTTASPYLGNGDNNRRLNSDVHNREVSQRRQASSATKYDTNTQTFNYQRHISGRVGTQRAHYRPEPRGSLTSALESRPLDAGRRPAQRNNQRQRDGVRDSFKDRQAQIRERYRRIRKQREEYNRRMRERHEERLRQRQRINHRRHSNPYKTETFETKVTINTRPNTSTSSISKKMQTETTTSVSIRSRNNRLGVFSTQRRVGHGRTDLQHQGVSRERKLIIKIQPKPVREEPPNKNRGELISGASGSPRFPDLSGSGSSSFGFPERGPQPSNEKTVRQSVDAPVQSTQHSISEQDNHLRDHQTHNYQSSVEQKKTPPNTFSNRRVMSRFRPQGQQPSVSIPYDKELTSLENIPSQNTNEDNHSSREPTSTLDQDEISPNTLNNRRVISSVRSGQSKVHQDPKPLPDNTDLRDTKQDDQLGQKSTSHLVRTGNPPTDLNNRRVISRFRPSQSQKHQGQQPVKRVPPTNSDHDSHMNRESVSHIDNDDVSSSILNNPRVISRFTPSQSRVNQRQKPFTPDSEMTPFENIPAKDPKSHLDRDSDIPPTDIDNRRVISNYRPNNGLSSNNVDHNTYQGGQPLANRNVQPAVLSNRRVISRLQPLSSGQSDIYKGQQPLGSLPNNSPLRTEQFPPNHVSNRQLGSNSAIGYTSYKWRISGLSECTHSCGGGIQQTVVVCIAQRTQAVVTDENCEDVQRPKIKGVTCNKRPCPAQWLPSSWSPCSMTCGEGQRTRSLVCQARVSPTLNLTMEPSSCEHLVEPTKTETCETKPCSSWSVGNWSECSSHCGDGVKYRTVQCLDLNHQPVDDDQCVEPKPETQEECNLGSCGKGWFVTAWPEECPVDCGKGQKVRKVFCASEDGEALPEERCNPRQRPRSHRPCRVEIPCGGHWFAGEWSKCNSTCGEGARTRDILCVKKVPGNVYAVVGPENCLPETKPSHMEPCSRPECQSEWYTTSWEKCSRSCATGSRTREIKCLSPTQKPSDQCPLDLRPRTREACNTQPCQRAAFARDGLTSDSSPSCQDSIKGCSVARRAGLCKYDYYIKKCCNSCKGQ